MKVVELYKEEQSRVKGVLEKALAEDFESVIIFGIRDGQYRVMGSGTNDRLKVIGFLEAAKMETWGVGDE